MGLAFGIRLAVGLDPSVFGGGSTFTVGADRFLVGADTFTV